MPWWSLATLVVVIAAVSALMVVVVVSRRDGAPDEVDCLLRFNYDFPEHDMYTVFTDGRAAADVTTDARSPIPLKASIAALKPHERHSNEPDLAPEVAETVVRSVAEYVVYGSEINDPCPWCDHLAEEDPMTRW